MNGLHRPPLEVPYGADKKRRNYKLIVDPQIHIYKGNQKIYRFDGISSVRLAPEKYSSQHPACTPEARTAKYVYYLQIMNECLETLRHVFSMSVIVSANV